MTDARFELRLERAARSIAQEAVRPVDAVEIAEAAIRAAGRADEIARPQLEPRRALYVLAAAALVVAVAFVGTLALQRGRTDVAASPGPSQLGSPSSSPSASPDTTPAPVGGPARSPNDATWLADIPAGLAFGGPSEPTRMALNVVAGPIASIELVGGERGLFQSSFVGFGVGDVYLNSDTTTGVRAAETVTVDGIARRPCVQGDEGRYRTSSTRDGLTLTFTLVNDSCPARAAVLARTWTRSISVPSGGGIGVVDGFDPLFTVVMPAGTYVADGGIDSKTIHQDLPELQLVSWKDPQPFVDPCDRSKGRATIAPGPEAFVAYVRQLAGFTVDSTKEVTVDGLRAVRLVVHADADATCPGPG
jgi:hypothetical protein